jgi:hypothetical protein
VGLNKFLTVAPATRDDRPGGRRSKKAPEMQTNPAKAG